MWRDIEAYQGENPHVRIATAARDAAARVHAEEAEKKAVKKAADDVDKLHDAVIVAIGICAVLIVNVCYVGYITPPGGTSAFWADCYYPLYVAFLYFNGFAFVFSVAAIVAVLVGPYVLLACKQPHWRKPVVHVGLVHVVISLATLLGAFACAGFILASVGIPVLDCAQLTCTEGGVPCNPFSIGYGDRSVSWNGTQLKRYPPHLTLIPDLARLNNDTLWEVARGESPGYEVTCRDYSYMAHTSLPGGKSLTLRTSVCWMCMASL